VRQFIVGIAPRAVTHSPNREPTERIVLREQFCSYGINWALSQEKHQGFLKLFGRILDFNLVFTYKCK
jgi:hypothetical protein